jgi:hypothetical protein
LNRCSHSNAKGFESGCGLHEGWTGTGEKGAREIFLSFFLLWPKKYFCGFARFRQFSRQKDLFIPIIFYSNIIFFSKF